jgi:penicillin-insensitive murein endopeptidase
MRLAALLILALVAGANTVAAQDKGSVNPKPLPPLADPDDPKNPAKELFARKLKPPPRWRRAPSASTRAAASRAASRCRSTARPGR